MPALRFISLSPFGGRYLRISVASARFGSRQTSGSNVNLLNATPLIIGLSRTLHFPLSPFSVLNLRRLAVRDSEALIDRCSYASVYLVQAIKRLLASRHFRQFNISRVRPDSIRIDKAPPINILNAVRQVQRCENCIDMPISSKLHVWLAVLAAGAFAADKKPATHWVATWGASPSAPSSDTEMRRRKLEFDNQTVRLITHVSLGGQQFRLRLANFFGTKALAIGEVHLAIHSSGAGIQPDSDRPVTFSGKTAISVPPGAWS
jgi:hypothetical protein